MGLNTHRCQRSPFILAKELTLKEVVGMSHITVESLRVTKRRIGELDAGDYFTRDSGYEHVYQKPRLGKNTTNGISADIVLTVSSIDSLSDHLDTSGMVIHVESGTLMVIDPGERVDLAELIQDESRMVFRPIMTSNAVG